jgi:hypothetical protein
VGLIVNVMTKPPRVKHHDPRRDDTDFRSPVYASTVATPSGDGDARYPVHNPHVE